MLAKKLIDSAVTELLYLSINLHRSHSPVELLSQHGMDLSDHSSAQLSLVGLTRSVCPDHWGRSDLASRAVQRTLNSSGIICTCTCTCTVNNLDLVASAHHQS